MEAVPLVMKVIWQRRRIPKEISLCMPRVIPVLKMDCITLNVFQMRSLQYGKLAVIKYTVSVIFDTKQISNSRRYLVIVEHYVGFVL